MSMLEIRLGGDVDEAAAFVELVRTLGIEINPSVTKDRGDGFSQVYGQVRVPGFTSPARPVARPTRSRTARTSRGWR